MTAFHVAVNYLLIHFTALTCGCVTKSLSLSLYVMSDDSWPWLMFPAPCLCEKSKCSLPKHLQWKTTKSNSNFYQLPPAYMQLRAVHLICCLGVNFLITALPDRFNDGQSRVRNKGNNICDSSVLSVFRNLRLKHWWDFRFEIRSSQPYPWLPPGSFFFQDVKCP